MAVLQLTKRLLSPPTLVPCRGFALRHYQGAQDIEPWLALRRAAFAKERLGVRDWARADFEAEFLNRWWWNPQHMWLAEIASGEQLAGRAREDLAHPILVGSVTLAFRGEPESSIPVIHWLVVHPVWQRRGIGSALMAALEAAVWDRQYRKICLETHDAWTNAAALYSALGYEIMGAG